jgi:hypothetical protein
MADDTTRHKTSTLAEALAKVLRPISGQKRYILAELAAAWREVAGAAYADCTYPEKLDWPRGGDGGGTLTVRVEGPRAVLLQHELTQLGERINAFLGHGAIARIRLLQGSIPRRGKPAAASVPAVDEARVVAAVGDVGDDKLRQALARLGRGIFVRPN